MRPHHLPPGVVGHSRTALTSSYAVIPPEGVLESRIPGISGTKIRILATPAIGANFAQMLLEIAQEGASTSLGEDGIEHFLYATEGEIELTCSGEHRVLAPGEYLFVAPGERFSFRNISGAGASLVWLKKRYQPLAGTAPPQSFFGDQRWVERVNKHTEGRFWQHLLPDDDPAFDMAMNILSFAPGTYFPMIETHIMQHGLYMLQGQGMYLLGNNDWHECWSRDFIWMGPFCPQFFIATGWAETQYLLFKDVNRDIAL
ncbi:(S)-ureidoglycine aminohydrolase [Cereibacter changlensis]|uniref:(S)-ureidoglycine aminohydrolase n=1 Tax=Cereibacter changlensis TaxID=402884 RepID=A0A4U0YVF1_9RHOB|nr:(S)-ureidoglycine aminohydrolase [Cereibacter changlensis]TKA96712.1 (S)-ureidoglycine aminohydrolase [Cereibacter changlensis]